MAGFSAEFAMGVGGRVPGAFIGATLAGDHTRVELGMHQVVRRFGLAQEKSCRGIANIRAIQVRRDAPTQHREMDGFSEAGVSA
jgi:hypothetical protein